MAILHAGYITKAKSGKWRAAHAQPDCEKFCKRAQRVASGKERDYIYKQVYKFTQLVNRCPYHYPYSSPWRSRWRCFGVYV